MKERNYNLQSLQSMFRQILKPIAAQYHSQKKIHKFNKRVNKFKEYANITIMNLEFHNINPVNVLNNSIHTLDIDEEWPRTPPNAILNKHTFNLNKYKKRYKSSLSTSDSSDSSNLSDYRSSYIFSNFSDSSSPDSSPSEF